VPLHRHSNGDGISYILKRPDGRSGGKQVSVVEAGECTVKGRGVWHTFWNPGSEPVRFLEIITPAEFAWQLADAGEIPPKKEHRTRRRPSTSPQFASVTILNETPGAYRDHMNDLGWIQT
jgi:uncharacterized cupin superfamily protein